MFVLEEPYLCINVIFVGVSSVLWLVFLLEILSENRQAEIASEYRN